MFLRCANEIYNFAAVISSILWSHSELFSHEQEPRAVFLTLVSIYSRSCVFSLWYMWMPHHLLISEVDLVLLFGEEGAEGKGRVREEVFDHHLLYSFYCVTSLSCWDVSLSDLNCSITQLVLFYISLYSLMFSRSGVPDVWKDSDETVQR